MCNPNPGPDQCYAHWLAGRAEAKLESYPSTPHAVIAQCPCPDCVAAVEAIVAQREEIHRRQLSRAETAYAAFLADPSDSTYEVLELTLLHYKHGHASVTAHRTPAEQARAAQVHASAYRVRTNVAAFLATPNASGYTATGLSLLAYQEQHPINDEAYGRTKEGQ